MSFEDDFGVGDMGDDDNSNISPPTENNSSNGDGSSNQNYNNDRFTLAFYKPKKDFNASDPSKVGSAFQCELTQYKNYNNVFISMAKQINPQTQSRGSVVFDWNNENNLIKFKCGTIDVQQILTILTYIEPEVNLFHKSQAGKITTFQSIIMGNIPNDNIQKLCQQFEKGDGNNKPRKSGINPKSMKLSIKSNDVEFKMMFLPFEVIGLKIFFEEALRKMYAKPYVKRS